MKPVVWLAPLLCSLAATTASAGIALTDAERAEIDRRLAAFYAPNADASVMSRRLPKYGDVSGRERHPNASLRLVVPPLDPLAQLAQAKSTQAFRRDRCRPENTRRFRTDPCPDSVNKANPERDDNINDLVDSWLDAHSVVRDLTKLPLSGEVQAQPWSDDYWRTNWGGLSYRYSEMTEFETYEDAINSYSQPHDWRALRHDTSNEAFNAVASWSPAEKYDLTVGDASFTLTNQQKAEGENHRDENELIPDWVGLCDGWAAAAVMAPAPRKSVRTKARSGLTVRWNPADVRALTTLAWTHGNYSANNIGGRCNSTNAATAENGRLVDQECFDTNPAVFHLALGNMIGVAHQSFIMDATFDAEVWNQPLISYSFQYFNPLDSSQRSDDWQQVAVAYDDAFKAQDRFQKPLTRGKRRGDYYDDSAIRKVVGVIATVTYASEYAPVDAVTPAPDEAVRVTYTYDLELSEEDGTLTPSGGEWQNNSHPDFLWIPRRETTLALSGEDAGFTPGQKPPRELTQAAERASTSGYPVCSVLRELVKRSSGKNSYEACVE